MDNLKKLLGTRIKELRRKRGITQEKLAELINIDQRNLSNIECGITFPSKSLVSIAKALEVELKDLFDYEHANITITEMKQTIISSLEKLDDREIQTIFRLIKSMI